MRPESPCWPFGHLAGELSRRRPARRLFHTSSHDVASERTSQGIPPPLEGLEGNFTPHGSGFATHGGITTSQAMAVEGADVRVPRWDEDGSVEEYFGQLWIIPSPSSHPARVLARGHHPHLV
jgi:hypothetical protein